MFTVDKIASNGHLMTYLVKDMNPETHEPIVSQWDATHSEKCPCQDRDY